MNTKYIIGCHVKLLSNDFITSDLSACITNIKDCEQKFLLTLDFPVTISNITYTHAVASPRLAKDNLDSLLENGRLSCAVTLLPMNRFNPNKPFDLGWWRGGGAVVTDIKLENQRSLPPLVGSL